MDEGFASKFTEKISVPIFTNDELVLFAKSYSAELGFKIDEMAILALHNRISNIAVSYTHLDVYKRQAYIA